MTPTERLHAEARKAEILKAALPVFAHKGFAGTTTKDLARAAGVSEGLLYKHFPSKESLYQALGEGFGAVTTGISDEVAKVTPSTEALVLGVYYLTRMVLQGPCGGEDEQDDLERMMCRSLLEDGQFARAFLAAAFLPYLPPLKAFFRAARAAGDLVTREASDETVVMYAHHLAMGIRLHALPYADGPGDIRRDEAALKEAVQFNLRGIGLKDSALRAHLDFKKLDAWYNSVFALENPPRTAPRPAPAKKRRKGT